MIDKEHGEFILSCDFCGEQVDGFDDFYDAVDYKKDKGWKNKRINGDWNDICPECQKGEE
jgi:hypothetical protein